MQVRPPYHLDMDHRLDSKPGPEFLHMLEIIDLCSITFNRKEHYAQGHLLGIIIKPFEQI